MNNKARLEPVWGSIGEMPVRSAAAVGPVDVIVVGAGMAGLSTAYCLCREGRRVAVLDSAGLAVRQTACTTAHLANALDDRYAELEKVHGVDACRLAAESHTAAIRFIEETVKRERIDCEFRRVDGFLVAAREDDFALLDRELEAARRAGLDVEEVDHPPIAQLDSGPALLFPDQAQFHPIHYLRGVARAITQAGGLLVTKAHVRTVRSDGKTVEVEVEGGPTLRAEAVVVATNTPVIDRIAIHTKQAAYLTYAMALAIPRGTFHPALLWDTEDPYHYVRMTEGANPAEELLIVGGEDHKVGQAHDQQDRFDRLERWARSRFPMCGQLRNAWSGQVLETIDGLAFLGRNPGDASNVYIATGDSGMGMTHGTIAGMLLTDLIQGRENPWAELYNPSRKPLGALRTFLSENLNTAAQYASWLTPGETKSIEEIENGCGAVVRVGLRKKAVYRDEKGDYHVCSAVCPHLGGIVTWNPVEQTWDCPAHGSRFSPKGQVINGPANSDLAPADPVAVAAEQVPAS